MRGAAAPAGPGPDPSGDAPVVREVLAGRTEAYATLVSRHQEILYRHARGMGLSHDVAEDLVQEAFITAYRKLDGCQDPDRFGLWLFRILRNRCLDHLKNIRRGHVAIDEIEPLTGDGGPEADWERTLLGERLNRALDRLGEDLRDAFLMKHHEEREYREMAEVAGASVSAMKMRVHRAREELRRLLTEAGAGGEREDVTRGPTRSSLR